MNYELKKEIDIYERTFQFAVELVQYCDELVSAKASNGVIIRQLLKSGTSIGANLEEGRAGQSRADFIAKLSIARKECRETIYWLRLLEETARPKPDNTSAMKYEAQQILSILTSIILSTKNNNVNT